LLNRLTSRPDGRQLIIFRCGTCRESLNDHPRSSAPAGSPGLSPAPLADRIAMLLEGVRACLQSTKHGDRTIGLLSRLNQLVDDSLLPSNPLLGHRDVSLGLGEVVLFASIMHLKMPYRSWTSCSNFYPARSVCRLIRINLMTDLVRPVGCVLRLLFEPTRMSTMGNPAWP
jgi:hypothetical protein